MYVGQVTKAHLVAKMNRDYKDISNLGDVTLQFSVDQ